jgi:DNA helicase-2/ATP-dependent DNA helicase PcrA
MADPRQTAAKTDAVPPAQGGPGSLAARALGAGRPASPPWFEGLNPEQREAVETTEGPLLVLAGAGTGKTRVLTARIAQILATGRAFPSQILAVTFTNKAAREMRERIARLAGEAVEGMPWLGTFHSIGVKILRRHAELAGLQPSFTILDTEDQIRLLKQIIRAEGIDDKRWPARQLAAMIDGWKNRGHDPSTIPEGDARAFANGKGRELFRLYQERLKVLNAVDFGDLLTETIRLFRTHGDVLAQYQRRFRYILVDEYQDTNVAQYLWLRLLTQRAAPAVTPAAGQVLAAGDGAGPRSGPGAVALAETRHGGGNAGERPNICCVGDDDQSIYGWRGAEVDNILRFERDFPGAKVIRLERNYRSTAHILAVASHLIAKNEGRLGKTLRPELGDPDAEKVRLAAYWDSEEEARAIGETIEQLQRKKHLLNSMAILVRASFQMREFEDRFVTMGLNYRVVGGPRFYERLEIRDALAYLRVVAQPADDLAFERIFNTPKRGLGETTLRQVHDAARARRIPLMAAARELTETEDLKPRARSALKQLLDDFARWTGMAATRPHTDLAEAVLDESGYTAMWRDDRSADAPGRLENLKELVRSMEPFENLGGFLEHVSLVMERDTGEGSDAVNLMTLHSAKGLEFDTVFLPGWEEGLFPHQRALDEGGRSGLEEERRLAYVGLTRAKRRAHVSFVSNRRMHGLWNSVIPSRFIDELAPAGAPDTHVEVAETGNAYGGYGATRGGGGYGPSRFDTGAFTAAYATPGWQRAQQRAQNGDGAARDMARDNWGARSGPRTQGRTIEGELVAASINSPRSAFTTGQRIFHQKFGYGRIAEIDGNKLTIDFDKAGRKRVLDGFVEGAG